MVNEDLLRQIFVKKSLKNNENGFQLSLNNPLSDVTIIKPAKISIKGEMGKEKFKDFKIIINEKEEVINKKVSESSPFSFNVKSNATLYFERSEPLPVGKYKITFDLLSEEYGELKFNMKEKIRE